MIASIVNQNKIHIYDLTQFDPYAILHSGQIFRYWEIQDGWLVMSCNHWASIIKQKDKIVITCDDAKYFYDFFDLDTDYQKVKNTLTAVKLKNAIEYGGGIRILRADFFEIVLSFIISANNNIKRFTKTLNSICEEFGERTTCGKCAFPSLEQCAKITVEDFKRLGCGYRSEYLFQAVRQLSLLNFNQLQELSNLDLQHELLKIKGVGPKVASCIMLFAFHRLDVAPVDTWIKKAIAQLTVAEQKDVLCGQYAGVAQQYIFYYLQHLQREVL